MGRCDMEIWDGSIRLSTRSEPESASSASFWPISSENSFDLGSRPTISSPSLNPGWTLGAPNFGQKAATTNWIQKVSRCIQWVLHVQDCVDQIDPGICFSDESSEDMAQNLRNQPLTVLSLSHMPLSNAPAPHEDSCQVIGIAKIRKHQIQNGLPHCGVVAWVPQFIPLCII